MLLYAERVCCGCSSVLLCDLLMLLSFQMLLSAGNTTHLSKLHSPAPCQPPLCLVGYPAAACQVPQDLSIVFLVCCSSGTQTWQRWSWTPPWPLDDASMFMRNILPCATMCWTAHWHVYTESYSPLFTIIFAIDWKHLNLTSKDEYETREQHFSFYTQVFTSGSDTTLKGSTFCLNPPSFHVSKSIRTCAWRVCFAPLVCPVTLITRQ